MWGAGKHGKFHPRSFLKYWDWEKKIHWPWQGRAEHRPGRLQQRHCLCWQQVSKHPAQGGANRSVCSIPPPITSQLGQTTGAHPPWALLGFLIAASPALHRAGCSLGWQGMHGNTSSHHRPCQLGHCASSVSFPHPGMLQTCSTVKAWVPVPH